jgi:anti-anti-sigma factor
MQPQQGNPLSIRVDRGTDLAVAHLAGSATMDQADRMTRELRKLADEPFRRLVLDLADMDFICSLGLGALIVAHVVCRRHNGQVVLAAPQPAIREILDTTRLSMVFPVFADLAAAMS